MALTNVKDPVTGTRFNFKNPDNAVMNFVGMVLGITLLLYAVFLSRNQALPRLDSIVSRLTGNRVSASDSNGGFGEVF